MFRGDQLWGLGTPAGMLHCSLKFFLEHRLVVLFVYLLFFSYIFFSLLASCAFFLLLAINLWGSVIIIFLVKTIFRFSFIVVSRTMKVLVSVISQGETLTWTLVIPHPVIVMILHNSVFDSSLFNFAGVKCGVGWGGWVN